ncbi:MAG TPA: hypothetical protein VFC47_05740 [Caulobacteraceae bacterium]|nr:hypothetical protein [Caulobacteraceae bacterium]
MKTYTLYIHDRRYSAPTMDFLTVAGDQRARELAVQRLASSPHYTRAELWEDERLVCELDPQTPPDQTGV